MVVWARMMSPPAPRPWMPRNRTRCVIVCDRPHRAEPTRKRTMGAKDGRLGGVKAAKLAVQGLGCRGGRGKAGDPPGRRARPAGGAPDMRQRGAEDFLVEGDPLAVERQVERHVGPQGALLRR